MYIEILSIIFTALIHIVIVIFAEGVLFLNVLSQIELNALDGAIKSSISSIFNKEAFYEYISKYDPRIKQTADKILQLNIEKEKSFINYQNQIASNNFYKIVIGLIIIIVVIYYYLRFVKTTDVDWIHIVSTVICIFVFIAIYELLLIFTTILKMTYNEDSILIKILNKL